MSSSPTSAITIAQANQELIERAYQAFARGDIPTVLEALVVDIHWHVPGRGPISGDYHGHAEVLGFFEHFMQLSSGQPYFNPNQFSLEALGQLGTAGRRMFHGPGINNWDLALLKDTKITESKLLQFRFEFFNAFNHAQFQNPQGSILNGTFGYVTNANAPRIGQVALKLIF